MPEERVQAGSVETRSTVILLWWRQGVESGVFAP